MSETIISAGYKTTAHMEIVGKDGKLVYIEKVPYPDWQNGFHSWRCDWCTKYRQAWTPPGLRQGKVNPLTFGFYLIKKYFRR